MKTIQNTLFEPLSYEATERQGIAFPCPVAREMPIGDERREHIKSCDECQRLWAEIDKVAYGSR